MTWGFMIGAGRTTMRTAWWMVTIPGIAILLTVLAINLLGDALNEALNPRLKQ
jgi:peptide/nickel transport system permease protein